MMRRFLILFLSAHMNTQGYGQTRPYLQPESILNIATWEGRRAALDQALQHYPLADPKMQDALVQLLNREEKDPEWQELEERDDFQQYEWKVSLLNQKIALTYNNEAAWRVLVYDSNYNPDSQLGLWLIQQPPAVKLILEMLEDSNKIRRGNASQMLAELIQDCDGKHESAPCLIIKSQQERLLLGIHRRILNLPDEQLSADIVALGICGKRSDVDFLDEVIRQHRTKMVNSKDKKSETDQGIIIWLCKDSQEKITQRLASPQPK